MTPEQYKFVKKILSQAYKIEAANQLEFVKKACQSEPKLVDEIMEMLSIGGSDEINAMDEPAIVEHLPELDSQPSVEEPILAPGTQISHYKVIKKIGSGGMGNVYSTQQKSPAERIVALKLLKKTPNQKLLISETQILARLNHPNIATLFEVDKTQDGQLFIAMEMIDGGDILSWCKQHHYGIKKSIELFQQLCTGISYAHEKGIIHCDIKPSNVLINEINGIPTVKIIDFGISRYEKQNYTKNEISGTPAYLAPEILANKESEITDTRRDVYALGVLLKKLLPIEVPKDLQAIINKAMAYDKGKRYASPVSLSNDINNYLDKRPVTARDYNLANILYFFIQRNIAVVIFSSILLLSLLGGFFAQYHQANIAKHQAQVARVAQIQAEELSDFLIEMFNTANPEKSNSSVITTDDLLHKAKVKLLSIQSPTLTDARFMHTIGSIYATKEKLPSALELIVKSSQINQLKLSQDHPSALAGLSQLGLIYKKLGDYTKAENYYISAIAALKNQLNPDSSQLSTLYNQLGNLYIETKQIDKAIEQHELAIEIRINLGDAKALADSYNNLGVIYNKSQKWQLARKNYYLALDIFNKEYDENHPYIGVMKNNLAYIEEKEFNWEKSEDLLAEAWVNWQFAYGENHSNTITAQRNLALFYDRRMRYQKAIDLFSLMIASANKNRNIEREAKYSSLKALSHAHKGEFEKANELHQYALELTKKTTLKENYLYARLRTQFAKSLIAQKRYEDVEIQLNQALNYLNKNYSEDNYYRLYTINLKADLYYKKNNFKQSQTLYSQVISHKENKSVSNQTRQVTANIGLGRIFRQQQKLNEAQMYFNAALEINHAIQSSNDKINAIIYYELAQLKKVQNDIAKAKKHINQALDIQQRALPATHKDLLATKALLKTL